MDQNDQNKKLSILLHGEEFVKMENEFKKGLAEVEKNNIDWFRERTDLVSGRLPDRLHNHWTMYNDGSQLKFWFHLDSELPKNIQDECFVVFDNSFRNK